MQSRDRVCQHPAPCIRRKALHTQRQSRAFAGTLYLFPLFLYRGDAEAEDRILLFTGAGMGWNIPYQRSFCALRAGGVKGAVHPVRAGAWEPEKSNIGTLQTRCEKEAVSKSAARAEKRSRRQKRAARELCSRMVRTFYSFRENSPFPSRQTRLRVSSNLTGGPKGAATRRPELFW